MGQRPRELMNYLLIAIASTMIAASAITTITTANTAIVTTMITIISPTAHLLKQCFLAPPSPW